MTQELSPIKKVWMERAHAGFLRKDHPCLAGRKRSHVIVENKTEMGLVANCERCKAGLAVKRSKEEIKKDAVHGDSDLRVACWMCGSAFSAPRTKDEYLHQMCAECLVAIEKAGLLKLEDPRTREVGGRPRVQAHLSQ